MVSRYGARKPEPTVHCFMSPCGHPPPQPHPPPHISQFRIISANAGRQGPDVNFQLNSPYGPQQGGGGGPAGGQIQRLHHNHHSGNQLPHQQQPQSQGQHSGGHPGPISTPPGHGDMNKAGPAHMQGQPQLQGQMQVGYAVPNQSRPGSSQGYFPGGPRGPPPRPPQHRPGVVNMPANNVQQSATLFQPPMQIYQSPQLVPAPLQTSQPTVMYPMFAAGQPRHQNHTAGFYNPQAAPQQFLVAAAPQIPYQSFAPHAQQGGPYYYNIGMTPAGPTGRPGVGAPGMAAAAPQQVIPGGPPPHQIPQTGQMPLGMMAGQQIVVSTIPNEGVPPISSSSSIKQTRRKYAIDIVDPKTMNKVVLYDESNGSTPPRSGDSSARETPQLNTGSDGMDVAADFAARVAKAASEVSPTQSQIPGQPPYSKSPLPSEPQVVNINGPDLNTNILPHRVDINQIEIPIKDGIIDDTTSWKQLQQPPSIGAKLNTSNKLIKNDTGVIKTELRLENDNNSNIVKPIIIKDPVLSDINSVSAVSVNNKEIQQVDICQSRTPVVSALTDNPSVEVHHRSREIYSSSKPNVVSSSQGNPGQSPKRKVKEGPVDKLAGPQTVSYVPSMSIQSTVITPTPTVDTRQCDKEPTPVTTQISETRIQKSPSPVVFTEDITPDSLPAPKEKREEKTPRDREKTSQIKDMEKIVQNQEKSVPHKEQISRTREKSSQNEDNERISHSQGRDQEISSINREYEKQNPLPARPKEQVSVSPVEVNPRETPHMIPLPNTTLPSATMKQPQRAASPIVPTEPKQTNGDSSIVYETAEGKATQRSKQKRQRMKDFNKKGAEKEGTDMDAFVETVNEDNTSNVSVSEPQPSQLPSTPVPTETIPTAPVPVIQSNKIADETDFSKDKEETEMEKTDEEKIVAARNEENAKEYTAPKEDIPQVIEDTPLKAVLNTKLKYKEDQWSPLNPAGKKKYERDFLMELQNEPECRKKPENFPNLEIFLLKEKQRTVDPRAMNIRPTHDAFAPGFLMRNNIVNPRGPPPKRNSQQKPKPTKPPVIHVSLSLKEDVKLHESENAWKPQRSKPVHLTDYEAKTEELYKKFRGILNKLTPQKFSTLVQQVQALPIDTPERLQGVINLVFEKAVDEPSFSEAYAQMCKVLSNLEVPLNKEGSTDNANFRKLLVTRCQAEFEKNTEAELNRDAKLKEIDEAVDPEKKKELQLLFEEEERKIRMKSVGNIRFIGELYKLQMLTANIMIRCITHLLGQGDEESLECLCKLLSTIGKDLETKQNLQSYFDTMKELSGKRGEISSRVRFMLQDAIELRQNKWVPRRDDSNPKTIDQIQKEAEKENLDMQIALSTAPQPPRRQDDRGISSGSIDRRKMRGSGMSEEGWITQSARSSARYPVDPAKIKFNKEMTEVSQLGSRSQFMNWKTGAAPIKVEKEKKANYNYYAALQQQEPQHVEDRRIPYSVSQSSRGSTEKLSATPSLEKEKLLPAFRPSDQDSRVLNSNSQQSRSSSRESSVRRTEEPVQTQANVEVTPHVPTQINNVNQELSDEKIEKETQLLLAEYLQNINLKEAEQTVTEIFTTETTLIAFVKECMNYILEKSSQHRSSVSSLICHLIFKNVISKSQYIDGVSDFLGFADDLAIDVPKFWPYVAESIAPLISAEVLSLADFLKLANSQPEKLQEEVTNFLIKDKGPNWIKEKSDAEGVQFGNIGNINNSMPAEPPKLNMTDIENKILKFLTPSEGQGSNAAFDQVTSWIDANIGTQVREPVFIRALSMAVCRSAIVHIPNAANSTWKLNNPLLQKNIKLLQKYIDNKEPLELQCLFAVQSLICELQHPAGLISQIFQYLWDEGIISTESFITWETNKDPQEINGKAVCLMSLTTFLVNLKEADDDDSCEDS